MTFLKKSNEVAKLTFDDFRGISLLACLSKLYTGCLVILIEMTPKPQAWLDFPSGGDLGIGADKIILLIHLALQKTRGWHEQFPLFIGESDIMQAVDHTTPEVVKLAMFFH